MAHSKGDPIYVDSKAMLSNRVGLVAVGVAMDLIMLVWWPTKQPFTFNPEKMAARLHRELPARGYTAATPRRHQKAIRSFFTVLPDGRWAPSPKFFSLTGGVPALVEHPSTSVS